MLKNIYIYLIVAGLVLSYGYYSQTKIEKLTKDNTKLILSNQAYENKISYMNNQIRNQQEQLAAYTATIQKNASDIQKLESLLSDHDLEFLSIKKPEMVERRINAATKKLFSEIENETINK